MNNIASERKRLELTQGQLAEKIQVDERTVRRWEKDDSAIPSTKAIAMSELFGCTVDYLFNRTEERLGAAASLGKLWDDDYETITGSN